MDIKNARYEFLSPLPSKTCNNNNSHTLRMIQLHDALINNLYSGLPSNVVIEELSEMYTDEERDIDYYYLVSEILYHDLERKSSKLEEYRSILHDTRKHFENEKKLIQRLNNL